MNDYQNIDYSDKVLELEKQLNNTVINIIGWDVLTMDFDIYKGTNKETSDIFKSMG